MDDSDTSAVNLGLKFQANVSGFINAVRFYKESDNTGTHLGSLWSSTGTLLASGTFSNETASGWQELDFSTPVAITAGTTYVASYHTNAGHYAITSNGLASAVTNGPLTALASGGVYAYGSANAFPSNSVPGLQLLGRRGVLANRGRHAADGDDRHAERGGDRRPGLGGAHGDVLPGGGAQHGVVHGQGFGW